MKRKLTITVILAVLSCLLILPLLADMWGPPQRRTVISANRQYAFTIIPSHSRTDTCKGILYSLHEFSAEELEKLLRDTLRTISYSQKPLEERRFRSPVYGGGVTTFYSREHLDERRAVWNKPLMNKLSPVAVIVTNSGQVVTLDDWARLGDGPNVIVVYDKTGTVVHRYSLEDIASRETIMCLMRSVSSIWWRKSFWLENNDSALVVELDLSNPLGAKKCPEVDTIRVPLY